jgi:hypothetical protein
MRRHGMREMGPLRESGKVFLERIRSLGADIRFTGGQPALPRIDGDLAILVDRCRRQPDGLCHRLTVCAGLPPPLEVRGLICTVRRADTPHAVVRQALTDRRGQVRLTGLEPIEYRVQVEPPASEKLPEEESRSGDPSPIRFPFPRQRVR